MPANSGFGKLPAQSPQSKASKGSSQRAQAAKQYEKLRTDGIPDFEVYIRIQGKNQWYPVGAIAVKRSNQINQAIFGSQKDLLEGAFRLYPVLRKNQHQLEYGYRLKQFKDEPIQLAVPPQNPANNLLRSLQERVSSLFSRG